MHVPGRAGGNRTRLALPGAAAANGNTVDVITISMSCFLDQRAGHHHNVAQLLLGRASWRVGEIRNSAVNRCSNSQRQQGRRHHNSAYLKLWPTRRSSSPVELSRQDHHVVHANRQGQERNNLRGRRRGVETMGGASTSHKVRRAMQRER